MLIPIHADPGAQPPHPVTPYNMAMQLNQHILSLNHEQLTEDLAGESNLLFIQDLDGVCMELAQDPMTRRIDFRFLEAARSMAGHFYVLTNGEFIGSRGVNAIVTREVQKQKSTEKPDKFFLRGLGGGGVQLQDLCGNVSHPGVSESELNFMRSVPRKAQRYLYELLTGTPFDLDVEEARNLIQSAVLDNLVSPTINANVFYHRLHSNLKLYRTLQNLLGRFMATLQTEAATDGLGDSFFIHYAPNLGRDRQGLERIKLANDGDAGTTDYQFLLSGAVKEVGVLVLLNLYYYQHTGSFPLGEHFNARTAPREHSELLQLARTHFDPRLMPRIVGVGDTVTSCRSESDGDVNVLRGGSDRGFLNLIQELGRAFHTDNVVIFVDSGGGEICRPRLDTKLLHHAPGHTDRDPWSGAEGITDHDDSLILNFAFPDGHEQYVEFFLHFVKRYQQRHPAVAKTTGAPKKASAPILIPPSH